MSADQVVLIIHDDYAQCSSCGGGVDYEQSSHVKSKGWKTPNRACGKKFTHIATETGGTLGQQWRKLRPDLDYIGVGWLVEGGTFALYVKPEHAFKNNFYEYKIT